MIPRLTGLRLHATNSSPERYLKYHPGCWIVYADDSSSTDPVKSEQARGYDGHRALEKQRQSCGVFYTLQAFDIAPTPQEFLCLRHFGVAVNLVGSEELTALPHDIIERRKEANFVRRLRLFPLQPHYLCETLAGFDLVFPVMPARLWPAVAEGIALNAQLFDALGGDLESFGLAQSFRVPGSLDLRRPEEPFVCRLLRDLSAENPYSWGEIRKGLQSEAKSVMRGVRGLDLSRCSQVP